MHHSQDAIEECPADDVPAPPARDCAREENSGRRKFIFFGALAAASAIAPRAAEAQRVQPPQRQPRNRKPPKNDDPFPTIVPMEAVAPPTSWTSPTKRLVRRATMGITAADATRAQIMGYQGWLNEQVNYTRIGDSIVNNFVATRYPIIAQTPEEIYNLDFGVVVNQLRESTIYRSAFSNRQLYQRMVEFWSDHLNIAIDKVGYLKVMDDRDVVRAHAMGRFSDLIMASAKSPGMLAYLDQNLSRVNRTNENYARELMELHTLGVDGGYSQQDVVELARVLTGWTFEGRGRFVFRPNDHDWGAKTVMGVTIPAASIVYGADGIKEGEQIIRMLVAHPNTARYISTKMLQWLLTPEPTTSQINTVSSVFRATGGDIKLMVRAILNSGWLSTAPLKFKRPYHLLTSGLRALNPSMTGTNTVRSQLDNMGHQLFDWETPDGYSDKIEYWAGNIITRWSHATFLSTQNNATVSFDAAPYTTGTPATVVDEINENFFGGEMSSSLRSALITYLSGGTLTSRGRESIALAMSSHEFQWY